MVEARQVLTAEYTFSDEPLEISAIDGLQEAIDRIAEAREGAEFVMCDDRVSDYKVYWNSKTKTVRIGAAPICASYEVPDGKTLGDYE